MLPAIGLGQVDRGSYRSLPAESRFRQTDAYLTKHWLDFYDPRQTTVAADLALMRAEATDVRTACLLRFFMFRNQAFEQTKHRETSGKALAQMRGVLRFAQANNLVVEEGIGWLLLSLVTREHQSPMDERTRRLLAYEGAVKGLNLLERVPLAQLADYHGGTYFLDHHLMYLGIYLFRMEEYGLALRMFRLGHRAASPAFDSQNPHFQSYAHFDWNFLNDMGECYQRLEQYPEAMAAYRAACQFGKRHRSAIQQAVSYGNMGAVLARQGQPAQALPYLEYAAREAKRLADRESEFNALGPLGGVYVSCHRYDAAFGVLSRAMILHDSLQRSQYMPPTDSTRLTAIYAGLAAVYQHRGDLNLAFDYSQRSNQLLDRQARLSDARQVRQVREKVENEAYLANLDQIKADNHRTVWQRNVGLTGLVLTILASLTGLGMLLQRRYAADRQLRKLANNLREQHELVAQLRADARQPVRGREPVPDEARLLQLSIFTPGEWDEFRRVFNQVHPQFLARLRQRYPGLTPAETRLICLSRLNLSTRDMAAMLGVSTDAVFKTRYRIRKKLNLPDATDIETVSATI